MNQIIWLIIIIIIIVLLFFHKHYIEGYENYKLNETIGDFPNSETQVLVEDTYPFIGKNQISNETSNDMWWHYPIFKLGSYKQITNNIKYPNNPDEGTCMPGSMCGALYHKKTIGSNYITPLPKLHPNLGTRIGYFFTNNQLIDSLPFRNNMQNILY